MAKSEERFGVVPWWIFDSAEFTAHETLVFCALCMFKNSEGVCFPSLRELSRVCKIGRTSVYHALKSLETKEAITVTERSGADGQTSNLYTVREFATRTPPIRHTTPPRSPRDYGTVPINNTIEQKEKGELQKTVIHIEREMSSEKDSPFGDLEKAARAIIKNIEEEQKNVRH